MRYEKWCVCVWYHALSAHLTAPSPTLHPCPAADYTSPAWGSSDYDSAAYYSPDHATAAAAYYSPGDGGAYTSDAPEAGVATSPGAWYGYGDGAVATGEGGAGPGAVDPTWDQTAAWNWTDMEPTSGYDTGEGLDVGVGGGWVGWVGGG